MLITIQYPIADSRPFLPDQAGRLSRPIWPAAEVGTEFVRSFGGVQKRFRGGVPGWIGEGVHCRASNAIKFNPGEPKDIDSIALNVENGGPIPVNVAFRRVYADGSVVAKVELGFTLPHDVIFRLGKKNFDALLAHLLDTNLVISGKGMPIRTIPLLRAGRYIAEAFCVATTNRKSLLNKSIQPWWTVAGRPVIFFESRSIGAADIPIFSKVILRLDKNGVKLAQSPAKTEIGDLPLWFMSVDSLNPLSESYQRARQLRICLLRLHAECECLRIILRHIGAQKIVVERRGQKSAEIHAPRREALQHYLNSATRKINGLSREADEISESDIADVARKAIDNFSPTQRSEIIGALKAIDVRFNILGKIKSFIGVEINIINDNRNMNDNRITIGGNVVNSQVGQTLQNCINSVQQQSPGARKELLEKISAEVKQIINELPASKKDEAPQIVENLEMLIKQATSERPNRRWYSVSAEGLLEASKWVKDFSGNIAGTIGQLGKLLWPDVDTQPAPSSGSD